MIDDIPPKFLFKWRHLLNLATELFEVPVALIMRLNETNLEVLVASDNPENPYLELATENLNSGLYCETVLQTGRELQVVDALQDSQWDQNPDIALGMIHYLGVPLVWPDGRNFGTLCVLDTKARDHANCHKKLLWHFKEQIESEFRIIEFESNNPGSQVVPIDLINVNSIKVNSVKEETTPSNNNSILVVDDQANQRNVLCAMLRSLGYQATAAASGKEALQQMSQQCFDLLVLDMSMPPGLTGPETYAAALKIRPQQKAIVSSGLLEPEEVQHAKTLGISTFLCKPYLLADLAAAVSSNLGNDAYSEAETKAGSSVASVSLA